MNDTIIVALISLAGIIITAWVTKSQTMSEMDKKIAVMTERLDNLDEHVREHNHYAKLFQENVPVIQEQIKVVNHRLEDLERKN